MSEMYLQVVGGPFDGQRWNFVGRRAVFPIRTDYQMTDRAMVAIAVSRAHGTEPPEWAKRELAMCYAEGTYELTENTVTGGLEWVYRDE